MNPMHGRVAADVEAGPGGAAVTRLHPTLLERVRRRVPQLVPLRPTYDDGPARTGNLTSINALPPVEAPTGFAELGVPARIDDGIAKCGFAQPFAIQTEAVPVAMQGRDVCGRAKTGSGKTLAFGVPMLARITDTAEPRRPLGLVLVPTRELAVQVAEVLEPIAAHAGQRVLAVYGGASRHTQIEELAKGVELVVATPLRLIDLLKSDELVMDDIQIVVLDEADRMADDGFTPQVEWVLAALHEPQSDDAVLGHARRRRRPPHPPLPERSGRDRASTRPPTPSARCTTCSSLCTTWTRTR